MGNVIFMVSFAKGTTKISNLFGSITQYLSPHAVVMTKEAFSAKNKNRSQQSLRKAMRSEIFHQQTNSHRLTSAM